MQVFQIDNCLYFNGYFDRCLNRDFIKIYKISKIKS